MSLDLSQLLQSQLSNVLGQFLGAQGETVENSARASEVVLPAIVAALLKNLTGQGQAGDSIVNINDLIAGESGSRLDNLLSQASSDSFGQIIELGKEFLPAVLGNNTNATADAIAAKSGVKTSSAQSLLALALPLVLSVLRGVRKDDTPPVGLLTTPATESWLSRFLDANLLKALGLGSIASLFGGTASATTSSLNQVATRPAAAPITQQESKGGMGKWIALAIAALLAAFAVKSCGKDEAKPVGATAPADSKVIVASDAASTAATGTTASAAQGDISSAANVSMASDSATTQVLVASNASPLAIAKDKAGVLFENETVSFFFATDKTDVAEEAVTVAADVIQAGKDGKKLVVSGYADSTGNAAHNEELSKKRAQAVQKFFEEQGVPAANIELRKPTNTTGAIGNDVEGRRVDVKVEG
ncbi:DUF937 domain-containing protein [Neisseriaceae bacterium B1]